MILRKVLLLGLTFFFLTNCSSESEANSHANQKICENPPSLIFEVWSDVFSYRKIEKAKWVRSPDYHNMYFLAVKFEKNPLIYTFAAGGGWSENRGSGLLFAMDDETVRLVGGKMTDGREIREPFSEFDRGWMQARDCVKNGR